MAVKDTCLVLLWIGFAGGQLHGTGEYTNEMEHITHKIWLQI